MGNQASVGSIVSIGNHRVEIVKQLGEGGFAYVFLVKDVESNQYFAVKRLLVNDKEDMAGVKAEINLMRQIPKHKNIVAFTESTTVVSKQRPNSAEVYIMMEFCQGPSLYGFLDQRFGNPFPQTEILSIFNDVCEAVAHLHFMNPPVAHRDLKVENVLRHQTGVWKLCDFGSATTVSIQPNTRSEVNKAEDEIGRHTTMCYRAPEMLDLYSGKKINEKVDIWALGCLLYRLCFHAHPFEDSKLAILNCNYNIPANSRYDDCVHNLIKTLLNPDPDSRPDIFEVMTKLSEIRGVPCPLKERTVRGNINDQLQSRPSVQRMDTPYPTNTSTPAIAKGSHQFSSAKSSGNQLFDMLEQDNGVPEQSYNFNNRRENEARNKNSNIQSQPAGLPSPGGQSSKNLFDMIGENAVYDSSASNSPSAYKNDDDDFGMNRSFQDIEQEGTSMDLKSYGQRPAGTLSSLKNQIGELGGKVVSVSSAWGTSAASLIQKSVGSWSGNPVPKNSSENDDEFWENLDREKAAEAAARISAQTDKKEMGSKRKQAIEIRNIEKLDSPGIGSSQSLLSEGKTTASPKKTSNPNLNDFFNVSDSSASANNPKTSSNRLQSSSNNANGSLIDKLSFGSEVNSYSPSKQMDDLLCLSSSGSLTGSGNIPSVKPATDQNTVYDLFSSQTNSPLSPSTSSLSSTQNLAVQNNALEIAASFKRSPSVPLEAQQPQAPSSKQDILALFNAPKPNTAQPTAQPAAQPQFHTHHKSYSIAGTLVSSQPNFSSTNLYPSSVGSAQSTNNLMNFQPYNVPSPAITPSATSSSNLSGIGGLTASGSLNKTNPKTKHEGAFEDLLRL